MHYILTKLFSKKYALVAGKGNIKGGVYSGQRDSLNAYYSYS